MEFFDWIMDNWFTVLIIGWLVKDGIMTIIDHITDQRIRVIKAKAHSKNELDEDGDLVLGESYKLEESLWKKYWNRLVETCKRTFFRFKVWMTK